MELYYKQLQIDVLAEKLYDEVRCNERYSGEIVDLKAQIERLEAELEGYKKMAEFGEDEAV